MKTTGVVAPTLQYVARPARRAPEEIAATATSATEFGLRAFLESLAIDPYLLPVLLFGLRQSSKEHFLDR